MANSDTFTGKTPADTYTKIVQISSDNELLDGIGGEISPVLKSGATITGSLNVSGVIYRNGVEVGTSTDSFWTANSTTRNGSLSRNSDIGIGTSEPDAEIHISREDSSSNDFFLIKDSTGPTDKTVFSVKQDGVVQLKANDSAPTVQEGGLYYNSTEKALYIGVED